MHGPSEPQKRTQPLNQKVILKILGLILGLFIEGTTDFLSTVLLTQMKRRFRWESISPSWINNCKNTIDFNLKSVENDG